MRAVNRAKLLWAYLRRRETLEGLPVEYVVETTAKCNLYCPMCPRQTHPQPNEDMTDGVFRQLVAEAGATAEHMMLIGLGEPFLDVKIYDRIAYCDRHGICTLLSTNGTLLGEEAAARLLATPLEHITLSVDGTTKESFEHYRPGARFEKVRDNFVRFARMKKQRGSKMQVVAQMVLLERNSGEVDDFVRFWSGVAGVDQVRIKQDETTELQPDARHPAEDWKHPCHYLWRGPMYVRWNGDVYPCCQSYALDGAPIGRIGEQSLQQMWNTDTIRHMRRLHAAGRAADHEVCARCVTTIPHPALVIGSLIIHGKFVRRLLPVIERLTYLSKLPKRLLKPPRRTGEESEQERAGARKERE